MKLKQIYLVNTVTIFIIIFITGCNRQGNIPLEHIPIYLKEIITESNSFDDIFKEEKRIQFQTPDTVFLGDITNIYINNDGDIAIIDRVNQIPLLFDSTGNFQRMIGRRGAGPGEFQSAVSICYNENEKIWFVADNNLRRLSAFNINGEFLYSFSTDSFVLRMRVNKEGILYLYRPNEMEKGMLLSLDSKGNTIANFIDQPPIRRQMPWFSMIGGGFSLLDDGIVAAHYMSSSLEYYSFSGKKINSFDLNKINGFIEGKPLKIELGLDEFMGSFTGIFSVLSLSYDIILITYGISSTSQREPKIFFAFLDKNGNVLKSGVETKHGFDFYDTLGRTYTIKYPESDEYDPFLVRWKINREK